MRGHEGLIEMRRRGVVPAIVFLNTEADSFGETRDWHIHNPATATVLIESKDRPETLDLRFLVGLLVKVDGSDQRLVERVTKACIAAKAARVIASVTTFADDRCVINGMTDTEGVFAWQP